MPQLDVTALLRDTLARGGVFMTRRGPVGREQVEREVLAQVPRDEAIDKIIREVLDDDGGEIPP